MRRLVCMILSVLLLTSCTATPVEPVVSGFRCQVDMEYDGTAFSGTFDRTSDDKAVLTVLSPDAVSGLTMTWDGQTVSLSYAGMELSVDEEHLPVGAAVKVLCETLDVCVEHREETALLCEMTGETACGEYTVCFDEQSGFPTHLDIPALPLQVSFSAWETGDKTAV